ncbi:MAG: RIP metalloprotease RseP [Nitrospinae bacterium]|nr:RIP metalloprotease RseP [Nitrospinota bacterium]
MNAVSFLSMFGDVTAGRMYGWLTFGGSAVIVLGLLIVAHEFGHFIVARLVGVRVEKFSIGFGPRIFSRKKGDTEYMVSWIPLGGYVKLFGDDPNSPEEGAESFLKQPVWKRLSIVGAGPAFNIALAIMIYSAAAMIGLPEGTRIIQEIQPDSPAATAGILPGDRIDAIDGVALERWVEVVDAIQKSPGKEIKMTVHREGGADTVINVTPKSHEAKTIDGKTIVIGQIGITPRQTVKSYPVHTAILKGAERTWDITALTVWSIGMLITRNIPADQIAGPIGIMKMAGDVAENGFVSLLLFIGLISVNLGILNLLPIPVLDGGHILFFGIEALLGRPVRIKHQEIAQQIGIFLLISLMAFAFYNDIMRLISG